MKALTSSLAVLFPFDAGAALASSESLRGSSPYADSPVPKLNSVGYWITLVLLTVQHGPSSFTTKVLSA